MAKVHQTFRLEQDVVKEAIKLAKMENRSISNLYSTAVIAYVLQKKLSIHTKLVEK